MHYTMNGWGWGPMFGMGGLWLVVLIAVIVVVVWMLRSAGGNSNAGGNSTGTATARPTPEDILRERFARGDINAEEYRERLAELRR